MTGNVKEWCFSSDNVEAKGGSYKDAITDCKISSHYYADPNTRSDEIGFRVVRRFIPD